MTHRRSRKVSRLRVSISLIIAFAVGCDEKTQEQEFRDWSLESLTPDQGFSFISNVFDVEPGQERQDCYFVQVPDLNQGRDLFVSRFKLAQNQGSHHLNVFRVKTRVRDDQGQIKLGPEVGADYDFGGVPAKVIYGGPAPSGECWKSGNWADWPLVVNTQVSEPDNPYTDWALPEGVAARFSPGEWLMVQTHYVNASTQKTPYDGRVGINFYLFQGAEEPMELGTLFATHQNVRICRSDPTPSYSASCRFESPSSPITITAVNGHFHSRGRQLDVYTWDGSTESTPSDAQRFYRSINFDDPPMERGLQIPAPVNGGIRWSCNYQWVEPEAGCAAVDARDRLHQDDCCYTFGPTVETSEHCNVFLYYYPATHDVTCSY